MADLLIRNIPATTLDSLRERARIRKRSISAEALEALQASVETSLGVGFVAWAQTVRDSSIELGRVVEFVRETREER